jgi:hypothetical protein
LFLGYLYTPGTGVYIYPRSPYLYTPVPGVYKYGDLALQAGGVSNETVKYGRDFCGTWTRDLLLWQSPEAILQVNYRPILSSERVLSIKNPTILRQKRKIWS